nr:cysteine hydrolase [Mycobacterium paraseoulense]
MRTIVLTGVSLNLALPISAGHITQAGFELIVPRDAVAGTPVDYGNQGAGQHHCRSWPVNHRR